MAPTYHVLMHPRAWSQVQNHAQDLQRRAALPGARLAKVLGEQSLDDLSPEALLEALLHTKRPMIFAESAVIGDGSDWNLRELGLLGDTAVAVEVEVFDDGAHAQPQVHPHPFPATLLFVPGALLASAGPTPADWDALVRDGHIDDDAFVALYERRLLPALRFASEQAAAQGRRALVTVPGLGCGHFAGPFRGQLGERLGVAIATLLQRHAAQLPGVAALYYDPYAEGHNARQRIAHITYLVRPLTQGNPGKSQLCPPATYAEAAEDAFADCALFSVVAWDHVSWPGNDYYGGARATDDGVKAAATSAMATLTGQPGHYDPVSTRYLPPADYRNWEEVVRRGKLRLLVRDRLRILP